MEEKLSALFQLINPDNSMSVNRYLAHSMGVAETIIYSALISKYTYYKSKGKLTDGGWFYSTIEDLQESTTYAVKAQRTAIKHLSELGLIESKIMGMPAKRYFRLRSDIEVLEVLIARGQVTCEELRIKSDSDNNDEPDEKSPTGSFQKDVKMYPKGQASLCAENKQVCPGEQSSLSAKDKQVCPQGQTSLFQKDKQVCPQGTNKFVPDGQTNINLNIIKTIDNQSIFPAVDAVPEHKHDRLTDELIYAEIIKALYPPDIYSPVGYPSCEEKLSDYGEVERKIQICNIPYWLAGNKGAVKAALRFMCCYSFHAGNLTVRQSDFLNMIITEIAEMVFHEKVRLHDSDVSREEIIDKLNEITESSSLYDCILGFEKKWTDISSKKRNIKNFRRYMQTTLWNWLNDYRLEEMRSSYSTAAVKGQPSFDIQQYMEYAKHSTPTL